MKPPDDRPVNPIDRDIADAFAALDQAVAEVNLDDFAARVLVRLDQAPAESEAEPGAEDSGLHDIRALASSARRRFSERDGSEADGDDSAVLLTAAHGGLRAVALPDAGARAAPGRGGPNGVRTDAVGESRRAETRRVDARSSAPFWILGSVASLAAAAAVAVFVFGIGRDRAGPAGEERGEVVARAEPTEGRPAGDAPGGAAGAAPGDLAAATGADGRGFATPPPPPPPEPEATRATEPDQRAAKSARDTGRAGGADGRRSRLREPSSEAKGKVGGHGAAGAGGPPTASPGGEGAPGGASSAEKPPAGGLVGGVEGGTEGGVEGGVEGGAAKPGGGTVSLDDMLDEATGKRPSPSPEAEAEKKKKEEQKKGLDRRDVSKALADIGDAVQRCRSVENVRGTVSVKFVVAPGGQVSSAVPTGAHARSKTGSCVARAVTQARFPAFEGDPISFTYPFVLAGGA
ncbi:MAG TPA: hypothetical protein VK698_31045 [Kofleriaceae bacterium]|nr:hypothetical protein [Kofleriaceae bacterium]